MSELKQFFTIKVLVIYTLMSIIHTFYLKMLKCIINNVSDGNFPYQ